MTSLFFFISSFFCPSILLYSKIFFYLTCRYMLPYPAPCKPCLIPFCNCMGNLLLLPVQCGFQSKRYCGFWSNPVSGNLPHEDLPDTDFPRKRHRSMPAQNKVSQLSCRNTVIIARPHIIGVLPSVPSSILTRLRSSDKRPAAPAHAGMVLSNVDYGLQSSFHLRRPLHNPEQFCLLQNLRRRSHYRLAPWILRYPSSFKKSFFITVCHQF